MREAVTLPAQYTYHSLVELWFCVVSVCCGHSIFARIKNWNWHHWCEYSFSEILRINFRFKFHEFHFQLPVVLSAQRRWFIFCVCIICSQGISGNLLTKLKIEFWKCCFSIFNFSQLECILWPCWCLYLILSIKTIREVGLVFNIHILCLYELVPGPGHQWQLAAKN